MIEAVKKIIGSSFLVLAYLLLPLPIFLVYGLRFCGRRHLRAIRETGVITVSNHCQYIEPVFTGLALWPRRIWYAVEENNINRKDVGWLNRLLGAFGIPDDRPMGIAGLVRSVLDRQQVVHFYPEGKLFYRNQKLRPFHRGAFLLALRFNVPVLPLTEVLQKRKLHNFFPFLPPKVFFIIGKPIFPEEIRKMSRNSAGRDTAVRAASQSAFFAEYVRERMQNTIRMQGVEEYTA